MNTPEANASAPATPAHTPGPWTVVLDEASADPLRVFQDDGTGNGDHIKLIAGDPESDANLRLIASAPELLAALKAVVSVADRDTDEFAAARAAIAKATGATA